MLMLAVSSTSAFFALADAVETVVADPGGIELELDEAVEFPDEGELILDDGALILDDDLDDGLALDGLLDLQLDENALLGVGDEAALGLEAASVEVNGGVQANTRGVTDSATVSMRCATIDEESGIQELLDFFINLTSTDIFELDRLEDRLEKLEDKLFTDGKPNDSGIDLILQYRKEILHKKRYYEQMELLSDELADLDHTFDFIDRY